MNKKLFLLSTLTFLCIFVYSQEYNILCLRDISPGRNDVIELKYGLQAGDKVRLYMETDGKDIGCVRIDQGGKTIFNKSDVNPSNPIEAVIPETGIVVFSFCGKRGGPDISLRIMRMPASHDGHYFNTALQEYKAYDTTIVTYEIDSIIGYEEIREPVEFKVIADVDYESVQLQTKKINLKGSRLNHVMITKPQVSIKTDDKEMELLGYQVMITSEAGAEKMWNAISIGVDVGKLALSIFLPAGGAAAAIGVDMMFSMIAPQEGGEPVYYTIMNNKENLDKFLSNSNDTRVFESGLATGYSGHWFPMDTLIVGLKNLNLLAEINVSVAIFAIYQSTVYQTIKQDIVTVRPKTVKVPRERYVISNVKSLGFQK